mgnify:CR=1 FL=1
MILEINNGVLYVDNVRFSLARLTDGSKDVRLETREVRTQYSHNHGRVLPIADGLGWLGADDLCAVVVGDVRGSNGAIPCLATEHRLVARIEAAEEFGVPVLIEIK